MPLQMPTKATGTTSGSDTLIFLVIVLLVVIMLGVAGATGTMAVKFEEKMASTITGVFSSMLLVSLFVERVIEVLLSFLIDQSESAVYKQNLDVSHDRQRRLNRDLQALRAERNDTPAPDDARKKRIDELIGEKRAKIEEENTAANANEEALIPFAAITRRMSNRIGLMVGVFTSAVGFRFLSQIVVLNPEFIKTSQYHWFVIADVLLTGAVLSGGSKLVHNLSSVYESYTESAKKSLTNKNKLQ